jgi:hypothetical protein
LSVAATVAAARLAGIGGGGAGGLGGPGAAAGGLGKLLLRGAAVGGGLMVGKDAYDWATSDGPAKKEDMYGTIGGGIGALIGGGLGFLAGGVGAVPGAGIGAGIGNYIGNWIGGNADKKAALPADTATAAQANAALLQRTGVLSHATAGAAGQYIGSGVDPETIEEMQDSLASRNREMSASFEEQQTASNKLLGTTGTLDETILSTNKAMKIFRDLIVSLNSVLGGVDEEGNPTSASPGAMPGGMMGGGMQGGGETDKILATIKQMESGNNYQAQNPTSSASGAYQFIDSTWQSLTKKAGIGTEYKSAKEAPAAIQDQIAQMYLQEIMGKAGGDLSKIPTAWFTGNVQGKSSAVSQEQVQKYVQKWMGIYSGMPGGANMAGGMGNMGGRGGLIGMFQNLGGAMGNMGMMGGGGQTAALALASQYLGMNETTDRQAIAAFLKAGGAGLDPKVEAWCAAFVNSALQQSGINNDEAKENLLGSDKK